MSSSSQTVAVCGSLPTGLQRALSGEMPKSLHPRGRVWDGTTLKAKGKAHCQRPVRITSLRVQGFVSYK